MHHLLLKYLDNTCTEEELDQVLSYLKSEPGQEHLKQLLESNIHTWIQPANSKYIDQPDYDAILQRIHKQLYPNPTKNKVVALIHRFQLALAVASLAILFALVIIYELNNSKPEPIIYQTVFGEKQQLILPDSSEVTLNANSTLKIYEDFLDERKVYLKGEAFFEVVKMTSGEKSHPFEVLTDRLTIEVLGTSFNVQEWKERTQVVLNTGKIKLTSADSEPIQMSPGEQVEIKAHDPYPVKKQVNPELYSSWKDDQLLCMDTPLDEIALLIEHTFGKKVRFDHTDVHNKALTGTLPLHDLSLLIEVLSESMNLDISVTRETLTIIDVP